MSKTSDLKAEIDGHNCGDRRIVVACDVKRLRYGWQCLGCGTPWSIRAGTVKWEQAEDLVVKINEQSEWQQAEDGVAI